VSTRSIVHAAKLVRRGITPKRACSIAVAQAITDEKEEIAAKWYEQALNGPTVRRAVLWTLYTIYALGLGVLFSKGIRAAHKLSWGIAVPLGVFGVIVYQGMYLVFNR
jgi:hypothetical protein